MLPRECRVKCLTCNGRGALPDPALERCELHDRSDQTCPHHDWCLACHNGEFPCAAHKCLECDGSGMVCPQCMGMRFVRLRGWSPSVHWSDSNRCESRCDACCEGNDINAFKERWAIDLYLTRWYARQRGQIAAVEAAQE